MKTPKCKKHPTYKGKRPPGTACQGCWLVWASLEVGRLREELAAGRHNVVSW